MVGPGPAGAGRPRRAAAWHAAVRHPAGRHWSGGEPDSVSRSRTGPRCGRAGPRGGPARAP
eukprot:765826-Hanusia_phi.AAC.1